MVIRAGVVGHPVAHSLSPRLHTRWLENYGIDGRYEAIDAPPDGFVATIARLRKQGYGGVNVTLPFKTEALLFATEATPLARRLGAANTLTFTEGGVHADNTDAPGFAAALRPYLTGRYGEALVLGAGGVAPAILAALSDLGVRKVRLANRTRESAEALAERFGAEVVDWECRNDAAVTDLLINTTALGLPGKPPLEIDLGGLPPHAVVADAVYSPAGTGLTRAARERGLAAMDGLPMLVHQAIPGFSRWFGVTPGDPEAAEAFLREAA
ncbi:shikimate dehydrogenase family protein [Parvularcula oceani]|uniref:shikimate dehydrogenase family protein n=1 Tax=Parvularcula oceani TaxID=1247963 RepID=UPI0004E25264|nr:shikimate dehydrogenase [Parvularcula oceani]